MGLNLVLIDTSVWVDHLNRGDSGVTELLRARRCPMHNFVLGEIALGNLPQWDAKVAWLRRLRPADPIEPPAFLTLLAELSLQGSGLGFVDAHLLAWAVSAPNRSLWSRDRRLHAKAETLGVAWSPA